MLVVALALLTGNRGVISVEGTVPFSNVDGLVRTHCVSCHSARPTNPDFPEAPKGVALDTPDEIRKHAAAINQQVVLSDIMPLGNESEMTENDRARLGAWIAQGAQVD